MERLVKAIPCERGELFVTSAGRRLPLAEFTGRIEIVEHTNMVPILGTIQKGTKIIYASFMVCGNLEYQRESGPVPIHSGMAFDAAGMLWASGSHLRDCVLKIPTL